MVPKKIVSNKKGASIASSHGVKELAEALQKYAPARCAKFRGAKRFAALEKLVEIPDSLRALWSWVDGTNEIIVAGEIDEASDLMSVAEAASATAKLRKVATFSADLVPFATDGAGNFAVVDARGRVLDWDHETRKTTTIAPSFTRLLARTMTAIRNKELWGGPEAPKGSANPLVRRGEMLLAKPLANKEKINELAARLPPKLAKEAFRLTVALREAVLAQDTSKWSGRDCLGLALRAAKVQAWDDAIAALVEKDKRRDSDWHDWWFAVGRSALEAGAFEHAEKACGKSDSIPAAVGALVARAKLGKPVTGIAKAKKKITSEIQRIEQTIAKDAKKRPTPNRDTQRYLAGLFIHTAALAMVARDKRGADAAVKTARGHWKSMDGVDVSLAKAMGVRLR
jgi:hypothetical protein